MRFLLPLLLFATVSHALAQHFTTEDALMLLQVEQVLKEKHIAYESIAPQLNARFPKLVIDQIDPEGNYLTIKDTNAIHSALNGFTLDRQFTKAALESIRSILANRLVTASEVVQSIHELDFFEADSIFLNPTLKVPAYAVDDHALEALWRDNLKLSLLSKYKGDSSLLHLSPQEIHSFLNQQLQSLTEAAGCQIETLQQQATLTKYVRDAYFNAFCQSFDPHSHFFSQEEKEDFAMSLSSEFYGTGITYYTKGSSFYVSAVSPFSPASLHPEIKVGDELIGVTIKGQQTAPVCISPEVLHELFYGDEPSLLEVELKSATDKQYRRFTLPKEVVSYVPNHTYAFLLQDEQTNLGYVQFPSFYSPLHTGGRSSAEDLAFILLSFKKKELDGVIIDLRNNSGGSIHEAIDLLGFFIDYGPLFTVVDQQRPDGTLQKDTKRGQLIQTKVMFLVNSLSGSASELVAATMQEYPHCLIVGSPTFGKATGQVTVPLETTLDQENQSAVHVTTLKINRFDGTNYQGVGVQPDIVLPSIINKSLTGENHYKYPLPPHQKTKKYRQVAYRKIPLDSLRLRSNRREDLSQLDSLSTLITDFFTTPRYISLNYEHYQQVFAKLRALDHFKASSFETISLEENEAYVDEGLRKKEQTEKDGILHEAFLIFKDWIDLSEAR